MHRKVKTYIFSVFSVIFAGSQFVDIQRLCYHGNKRKTTSLLYRYNSYFKKLTESLRSDWSTAMVYESIDHGNDVTCHAVLVVSFLVFRKNNFTPQHGLRRTTF